MGGASRAGAQPMARARSMPGTRLVSGSESPGERAGGLSPRVAAVIGDPVRHSRSPAIHNAAFAEVGLDWVFAAFEIPAGSGARALEAARTLGLAGLSVTMPLKAEAAAAADEASDAVRALDAANCVVVGADGWLRAENTDGTGFAAGLAADAGLSPQGRRAAVIGAGGAARAVVRALGAAGAADVAVINRTESKAVAAAALAGPVGRLGRAADDVPAADLVVNATPAGMGADVAMPCDPGLLHRGQVAVDLIYEPLETPWLAALRAAGVEAHNGLSMLVYQAATAFELWTGAAAPVEVMRRAALAGR